MDYNKQCKEKDYLNLSKVKMDNISEKFIQFK